MPDGHSPQRQPEAPEPGLAPAPAHLSRDAQRSRTPQATCGVANARPQRIGHLA
ncbi:hypothetical protein [Demequina globuliformis]|uniref:hypothetical protein n=1 Tax=Demequina globuliformis TaxID=676202 RepID=UPI0013791AE5|nr:hypothetical protein [Demequina globuliformis]